MDLTGFFEGMIIGAGTKLRTAHSNLSTILSSHAAGLTVKATKKWLCEVADTSTNVRVGDTWIYVTEIGGANVVDGWMAVTHHGAAIVNLTVDQPDVVAPPDVPADQVVTNSITYDFNAAGELVAVWVNGEEWKRFYEPPIPPMGVTEGSEE